MDIADLEERLGAFARAMTEDASASVSNVATTEGHAGFSYFFDVTDHTGSNSYFLRLPPPGVKLEGTADVLRQVCVLKALDGTVVPHARVVWSGDDPRWFGSPYFVTPRLPGEILRGEWLARFSPAEGNRIAQQSIAAMAGIHRVDPARCDYLGEFWGFEFDVTRWDRFYERAAEPQMLALQPRVRELLLESIPADARIGVYHGDFQWGNVLVSAEAEVLAVIDWELTGIGAVLNDLGWLCLFNEPAAWAHEGATPTGVMPPGEDLESMYAEAWGAQPQNLGWFKALAAYKFSIISGLNLALHRRGKRHDPHWEEMIPSMKANMEYAFGLLTA